MQMLCAYYDKTCDSHRLFDNLAIAGEEGYEKHINKYDVIYLDMTQILAEARKTDIIDFMTEKITDELLEAYPSVAADSAFTATLVRAAEHTGNKFIMIIDEWDAPIREKPWCGEEYLRFLRMLFKSSSTTARIFDAAYMTGILPIKKDGSQSAISDFQEYSMIKPRDYGEYAGFTEAEVKRLCREYDRDFQSMKLWYDGYFFKNTGSVYNPNSVMQAIDNGDFDSYWTETAAAEKLMEYISKDYNGLTKTVAKLIGGVDVTVNTNGFANDLATFRGKDDVLTLLIHLGYLAYDLDRKTVRIPNEEIRMEFSKSVREVNHTETLRRLRECRDYSQ